MSGGSRADSAPAEVEHRKGERAGAFLTASGMAARTRGVVGRPSKIEKFVTAASAPAFYININTGEGRLILWYHLLHVAPASA